MQPEKLTLLGLSNDIDIDRGAIFPTMPDLALRYLQQYMIEKGYSTRVFDEHVDGPADSCPEIFGDFVGVSMYGLNNKRALERIRCWKRQFPSTQFILGGSSIGTDITDLPEGVDYLVIGRGYEILQQILDGALSGIYRSSQYEELDFALTLPVSSLYKASSILSSFGCPYKCKFCLAPILKAARVRKKEHVLKELDSILESSHIQYFEFFDNILPVIPFLSEILHRISGAKPWGCVADVRRPNLDTLHQMRDAGLVTIGLGIETLNNKSLVAVDKRQTAERVKVYLQSLRPLIMRGLRVHAFLMYGLPFQTKADCLSDVTWLAEQGIPAQLSHLRVPPGSELWTPSLILDSENRITSTTWISQTELLELDEISVTHNRQVIQQTWGGLIQ